MGSKRQLQAEIDRLIKKVQEGIETFTELLGKVHTASTPNQKEKYEAELKKEINKLQRYRNQIKTWIAANEPKDKRQLIEYRKLIEQQMESFKNLERELKTKAYSKVGLSMSGKEDQKDETRAWISKSIKELKVQIDGFETELENLQGGAGARGKRGKGDGSGADKLTHAMERHKWHIRQLERVLRGLENDEITVDQVHDVKESVEYYIESSQEPDFMEDEAIYESILGEDDYAPDDGGAASDEDEEAESVSDEESSKKKKPEPAPAATAATATPAPTAPLAAAAPTPAEDDDERRKDKSKAEKPAAAAPLSAEKGKPAAPAAATPMPAAVPSSPARKGSVAVTIGPSVKEPPPPAPAAAPAAKPAAAAAAPVPVPTNGATAKPATPAPPLAAPATTGPHQHRGRTRSGSEQRRPGDKESVTATGPAPTATAVVAGTAGVGRGGPGGSGLRASGVGRGATTQPYARAAAAGVVASTPTSEAEKPSYLRITKQDLAQEPAKPPTPAPVSTPTAPPTIATPPPASVAAPSAVSTPQSITPPATTPPPVGAIPTPPPSVSPPTATTAIVGAGAVSPPATTPSPPGMFGAGVDMSTPDDLKNAETFDLGGSVMEPGTLAEFATVTQDALAGTMGLADVAPPLPTAAATAATAAPASTMTPSLPSTTSLSLPSIAALPIATSTAPGGPVAGMGPTAPQQPAVPKAQALKLLSASLSSLPDAPDSERPRRDYVPRNPVVTPPYFPQMPVIPGAGGPIPDPQAVQALFEKFDIDTLFFIFYYQQGTYAQYLAARELKRQSWRYHKKYLTWFQRHEEPKEITNEYEQGTYVYFDYETGWCQRKKTEFTFEYRYLEDGE